MVQRGWQGGGSQTHASAQRSALSVCASTSVSGCFSVAMPVSGLSLSLILLCPSACVPHSRSPKVSYSPFTLPSPPDSSLSAKKPAPRVPNPSPLRFREGGAGASVAGGPETAPGGRGQLPQRPHPQAQRSDHSFILFNLFVPNASHVESPRTSPSSPPESFLPKERCHPRVSCLQDGRSGAARFQRRGLRAADRAFWGFPTAQPARIGLEPAVLADTALEWHNVQKGPGDGVLGVPRTSSSPAGMQWTPASGSQGWWPPQLQPAGLGHVHTHYTTPWHLAPPGTGARCPRHLSAAGQTSQVHPCAISSPPAAQPHFNRKQVGTELPNAPSQLPRCLACDSKPSGCQSHRTSNHKGAIKCEGLGGFSPQVLKGSESSLRGVRPRP